MSLNIKNPEDHALAARLAQKTGETLATAVTTALRERLARLEQKPDFDEALYEKLKAIATDTRKHMKEPGFRWSMAICFMTSAVCRNDHRLIRPCRGRSGRAGRRSLFSRAERPARAEAHVRAISRPPSLSTAPGADTNRWRAASTPRVAGSARASGRLLAPRHGGRSKD
jgi:hypothetical protein